MRHLQKLFLVFALLILLIPLSAAQDRATWTIMVYMEADNNLEGDALADLLEMEFIGSSPDVNIIVQIDRAVGYANGDGDWTGARRYYVTRNENLTTISDLVIQKVQAPETLMISSQIVEELGEINNGDPQTLIDFALWGATNYPAEKYGLVMWNHGGAWIGGFGGDESTQNHDGINLPELDAALSLITEQLGQNFEFIGFDTCLMGQMEIFSILAKYSNYAAGAEELEPGFGWYYAPALDLLVSNPNTTGGELAEAVVHAYMGFYDDTMSALIGGPFFSNYDQTAVDLSKYAALEAALTEFSLVAQMNMASITPAIADARNNVQFFGGATPDEAAPLASIDLIHFMELLIRFSDNTEVNNAAQAVIAATNDFVIVSRANDGLPHAKGVSIFFPRNATFYTNGTNSRYTAEVSQMAAWQAFLDSYFGLVDSIATEGSVEITDLYTPQEVVSSLNPPTIVFTTNGTNITSLSFTAVLDLGDGVYVTVDESELESLEYTEDGEQIVDIPDGESTSTFTWTVEMPVITDGNVSVPTLLLDIGTEGQAAVSGLYGYANGTTVDAFLIFDLETNEVLTVWGVNESENGGQPYEIRPVIGEEFLPTWRFYDEEGVEQLIPANDILVFSAESFTFDFYPADSGLYELYIVMEDASGAIDYDYVSLEVNNEGIEPILRGANNLNYGYSYQYPWDWAEAIDIVFEDVDMFPQSYLSNPDETVTTFFTYLDGAESLDEVLENGYGYLDNFASEYEDFTADVLGGYDAYITSYLAETEAGEAYQGIIGLAYNPETAIGYIIDVQILAGGEEEGEFFLDTLYETLTFFIPPDFD